MTTQTQTGTYGSAADEPEPLQPFLFLVVQGDALGAPAYRLKLAGTELVRVGRAERRGSTVEPGSGFTLQIGVTDTRISKAHCELRRDPRGWLLVDLGSKNGTRVNGTPVREQLLEDGALIELGRTFLLFCKHHASPGGDAITRVDAGTALPGLATLLPRLVRALGDLRAIAPSRVPVLVRGESGTGKELAAAALHALSGRSGPFVPVNCGALPASLAASELFGYRKGAFSGALEDRPGLVRAADGGTLFLDEVAELQPDVQAALLRVLQEGEVLPLGATRPVKAEARIVAATHRDLEAMVASGEFREDLLARLSGFTLRLPPLRARREDLGLVLAGLIQRRLGGREVRLKNTSLRRLFAARFERNARELEQAVVAAATLAPANDELELELGALEADDDVGLEQHREADLRARLVASLRTNGGNISAVALELGKARTQVHRWLKRFGIDARAFAAVRSR